MTNREWLLNKMQNMSDEELAEIIECRVISEIQCGDKVCNESCKVNWLREEYKIKLSEAERIILENIDKDYKWIVRTKYGHLEVCKDKPEKEYVIWTRHHGYFNLGAFNHLFQFITWEDNEPYNIEELLKGE